MKNWLSVNWFKSSIVFIALAVAFSIFYYYLFFLPREEAAKMEQQNQEQLAKEQQIKQDVEQQAAFNRALLNHCLEESDNRAKDEFAVICVSNDDISGGTQAGRNMCYAGTTEDIIEFMTVSEFRNSLFKGILDRRNADRAECLRKYP